MGKINDLFKRSKKTDRNEFPLSAANPLAEQHQLISKVLEQSNLDRYYYEQRLKDTKAGTEISQLNPDGCRLVVKALVERLEFLDDQVSKIAKAEVGTANNPYWPHRQVLSNILGALLRRKLPLTEEDILELFQWVNRRQHGLFRASPFIFPLAGVIKAASRLACGDGLPKPVVKEAKKLLTRVEATGDGPDRRKLTEAFETLLGTTPRLRIQPGEAWSDLAIADIKEMDPSIQRDWIALINHCHSATSSKPSAKWTKAAIEYIGAVGEENLGHHLQRWFPLIDKPRTQEISGWSQWVPNPNLMIIDIHLDILRGLVWCCSTFENPELARRITALAISAYKKVPGIGPRAVRLGNACVWCLGELNSQDAVGQLALLKVRVRFRTAQKGIDKALRRAADAAGVTLSELEEMSVPAYGLTEVGELRESMGDVEAHLVVTGTTSTELRWIKLDAKGNPKSQKSVPAVVKKEFPDELKELKAAAKDIEKMLPAQRTRIEFLYLHRKSWEFETWRERYIDHPLVGTIARRLIWNFHSGDQKANGTWREEGFVDSDGNPISGLSERTEVSLWHPIEESQEDVMGWRRFFESNAISQPFKQAHREVYLLTDAERQTQVYSNRFAAHIVRQHQCNALCAARGWKSVLQLMVDDVFPPPSLEIPEYGLRAEFWTDGAGDEYGNDTNETGVFLYLATDQVRFYPIDTPETQGGYAYGGNSGQENPTPLEEIPPLVLSEVFRDVDLFVGVASVGNDPNWADGGREGAYREYWNSYSFGDLSETAKTRRDTLERLVPRLKIADRCELRDRFLVVRGDIRTYKIHLGSGNILMEPNDSYLCIVPGRGKATTAASKVFLPFEGDGMMSIILSKAFLLADDKKIEDTTILSQIGRGR